ncbi:MAG: S1 RNA-binding domain-containing protein [Fimbriimonadaceae bacterium]
MPISKEVILRVINDDQQTPVEDQMNQPQTDTGSTDSTDAGVTPSPEATSASEPAADATKTESAAVATGGKTEDELLFEQAFASLGTEDSNLPQNKSLISKGERIEARVIQVENDRVFVDLGTKAEGVVPLSELAFENLETAVGHVKPGDTFEVIVLKTNSAEGNPVVSKRRADFDVQWQRFWMLSQKGTMFEANVVERVKGGLVVDIGVRGFVPATHVGSGKLRNIEVRGQHA